MAHRSILFAVVNQKSKSQNYGYVSARNTTRAPDSMQLEIKAEKYKSYKAWAKRNV